MSGVVRPLAVADEMLRQKNTGGKPPPGGVRIKPPLADGLAARLVWGKWWRWDI